MTGAKLMWMRWWVVYGGANVVLHKQRAKLELDRSPDPSRWLARTAQLGSWDTTKIKSNYIAGHSHLDNSRHRVVGKDPFNFPLLIEGLPHFWVGTNRMDLLGQGTVKVWDSNVQMLAVWVVGSKLMDQSNKYWRRIKWILP